MRRAILQNVIRCVVLHEIAERPSPYTKGLNITTSPQRLRKLLDALARDYTFVDIRALPKPPRSPKPPLLVTFDDSYASLATEAEQVCLRLGIPAAFFLNARYLDNADLALDNLLALVVANGGMSAAEEAAGMSLDSLGAALHAFVPTLRRSERERFATRLAELAEIDTVQVARTAGLYLTSEDVRRLAAEGFTIANHTYSHVHCRSLTTEKDLAYELGNNKTILERIVNDAVDNFSFPYGSRSDATPGVRSYLNEINTSLVFFAYGHANVRSGSEFDRVALDRVDVNHLARRLERLPLLRAIGRWATLPIPS